MAQTIPSGYYFGFTKQEVQAELVRYKEQVKLAGSNLVGASQNGQSYNFGPRADLSLSDWQQEIQNALAFFGLACELEPPRTAIDFRSSASCSYGQEYPV